MSAVEERSDYWQTQTSQFIRGRVTLDDLHAWLRERDVSYTFEDSDVVDGNLPIVVETVRPSSLRCESVQIILNVQLDSSEVVQSLFYDFDGRCFW